MSSRPKDKPAPVPARAMQAGEVRARWAWVEPTVWTDRMLTTLEQGVKGGKWYSLVDKHSTRYTFERLDAWLRMRLRSVLRRRARRRGRGRGWDPQRWPKAYFTEQGLFSLTAAHVAVCQPSQR